MANEWKEILVSQCTTLIKRGISPKYTDVGGTTVLNQKCIRNQRVSLQEARRHSEDKKKILQDRIIETGDVLVNSTGVGTLGRVAQVKGLSETTTVDSHITIVRPDKSKIDANYFGLAIREKQAVIENLGEGSTGQTELSRDKIANLKISLPPLPEQRAIAHVLGALDNKIELNRKMNETLEGIAQTLFQSWFVDFDPVKAKAEGRKPAGMSEEIAALFPDGFEDSALGKIPMGWKVLLFNDLIDLIGGGTPKTSASEYWNGNIPWFSVADAPNASDVFVIDTEKHITQFGVDKSSTSILPIGTTIISARGTVGKCAMVGQPMAMNQSCYGVRGKNGISDTFVYYATCQHATGLQRSGHGSVFNTITRDTFKTIQVPFGKVEITQKLEECVRPFFDMILANCFQQKCLSEVRDSLLPKLISGEIRIKDAEKLVSEII